jgi:carbon catabolite-derepressing protein kinase
MIFNDEELLSISLSPSQVLRIDRARERGGQRAAAEMMNEVMENPRGSQAAAQHQAHPSQQAPQREKVRIEQRIGAYNIIRTLGEGSFGKVKLAVHRMTGQKVALKIIARKKLISRDMQGRVEREIEYLQLLRHPHIIKL